MMHITIRHAEPEDFQALNRIHSQPGVIWGTLQVPFPPTQRQRDWLSNISDDRSSLVACVDDEVIGSLGLHFNKIPRRRHVASMGMAIHDDWHGQGIGSALMRAAIDLTDNWFNIKRLELHAWTDNERAIALYKKFGFVIEGTCRCYAFRNGEYVDAYAMARVRE